MQAGGQGKVGSIKEAGRQAGRLGNAGRQGKSRMQREVGKERKERQRKVVQVRLGKV
jgi:hypothetical protein